jgi:hypothetical protein
VSCGSDLEQSVEDLKSDVIARKCRIQVSDVEGLALVLSNITKNLADLKGTISFNASADFILL